MSHLYTEGYFERAEGSNYRHYGDEAGWDPILNVLSEYRFNMPPDPVLLEVACAKGYFVAHALDWGWNAWGFDISEYAISRRPQMVSERVFVHDATETWHVDDGVVDCLVSWEFFEHVEESDVPFVWSEMLRVTKPGGLIVLKIGMPVDPESPHYEPDVDVTHVTMHGRDWWEGRLTGPVEPMPGLMAKMDQQFADRDWAGRFFAWRKA